MVKLKEEFDYKSLCRRMEAELDRLVAENERQAKLRQENDEELDRTVEESRLLVMEAENRLQTALEVRLKLDEEGLVCTLLIELGLSSAKLTDQSPVYT